MSLNNPTKKEKRIIRIAGGAVGSTILIASLSQLEGILASIVYVFVMLFYLFSAPLKVDVTCTLPEDSYFIGETNGGAEISIYTYENKGNVLINSGGEKIELNFNWHFYNGTDVRWPWESEHEITVYYQLTTIPDENDHYKFTVTGSCYYNEMTGDMILYKLSSSYNNVYARLHDESKAAQQEQP
jgi:hypothetical protein